MQSVFLVFLGFFVGTFGTLVGAGGGFILIPILIFLFPDRPTDQITAISLAVVFFNATSGTLAYARKGRVDFRSGIIFSIASMPGAILGAYATSFIDRHVFEPIFAVVLMAIGVYLFMNPRRKMKAHAHHAGAHPVHRLVEKDGTVHELSFSMPKGIAISVGVGLFSSLLGLGGGIIHVPALVQMLEFPVHVATATSHFILVIATLVGSVVHLQNGTLQPGLMEVALIAPSVIVGAQIGARLSAKIHGDFIIRALAFALFTVGVRLLWPTLRLL